MNKKKRDLLYFILPDGMLLLLTGGRVELLVRT